jgi:hypothetical protein
MLVITLAKGNHRPEWDAPWHPCNDLNNNGLVFVIRAQWLGMGSKPRNKAVAGLGGRAQASKSLEGANGGTFGNERRITQRVHAGRTPQ